MRYGSVCSGIEAATQAWHGLGWEPAFFSDIEKFPVAVLQHHYPDVPCHGDFTTITEDEYGAIDLLVGGTPCQSFSVAGLRGGMDDERGNLALEFIRLAQRKRPQWLVWENVPGVLSSNGGRDFGSFLGALAEIGYGFAYRVLDAQYFGVAQRRRRVFVVGYLGDWRRAAAVLFERESLSGNPAPIREEGEKVAPAVTTGPPFSRTGNERVECEAIVPMRTFSGNQESPVAGTLETTCHDYSRADSFNMAVAFADTYNGTITGDVACTLSTEGGAGNSGPSVLSGLSVRRLTPTECERLQGFPDSYTQIPWRGKEPENCPDGPRYKALGNSMAVPCMRWIGERIQAVEAL
jgi:DNA (cytosine-5)-methyltransferase 1